MGLVGAIVIEDEGDAHRRAIGVTDEVLIVSDTPRTASTRSHLRRPDQPPTATGHTLRQPNAAAARQAAANAERPPPDPENPVLDPRIDQTDQAGECALGATTTPAASSCGRCCSTARR